MSTPRLGRGSAICHEARCVKFGSSLATLGLGLAGLLLALHPLWPLCTLLSGSALLGPCTLVAVRCLVRCTLRQDKTRRETRLLCTLESPRRRAAPAPLSGVRRARAASGWSGGGWCCPAWCGACSACSDQCGAWGTCPGESNERGGVRPAMGEHLTLTISNYTESTGTLSANCQPRAPHPRHSV